MAGHSKWANIRHRKGAQDLIRSKEFAKCVKEITVAAKNSDGDINNNSALKLAVTRAKSKSVPIKTIQKAINKATGKTVEGLHYKEYTYEGYLSNGISIMIMCVSENHNRISANIKSYFNKVGGSLAKQGAVSYLFDRKGVLEIVLDVADEETIMETAIKAGASDVQTTDESYIVTTEPSSFARVKDEFEKILDEIDFNKAGVVYIPKELIKLKKDKAKKILDAINEFKNDDDVEEVFHNLDL